MNLTPTIVTAERDMREDRALQQAHRLVEHGDIQAYPITLEREERLFGI
jgi:hypothetical protein